MSDVTVDLSDAMVPLRRPHFTLREHALFFLLSTRAHLPLDGEDERLWNSIDGVSSIGQLGREFPSVRERLRRLWDKGVCEIAPGSFPAGRRRVLVLEPHMDDAILSVGGVMWSLRNECEFTLATIASRSNFTSYYFREREFFDVDRVSALRRAESSLAMRLVGGTHVTLDLPEAPLRFQPGNWTIDWYRRSKKLVDAFIMHASPDEEIESWSRVIHALLSSVPSGTCATLVL
jgi:hypothetical protein